MSADAKELTLSEATDRRDLLRTELESHGIRQELSRLEQVMQFVGRSEGNQSLALQEAWGDLVDRNEWRFDDSTFNMSGRWEAAATSPEDRKNGKDRVFFETEQDLHIIRGTGRFLVAEVEYAIGILSNLTNYTVGTGSEVSTETAPGVTENKPLLAKCQGVIDRFAELNDWFGDRDREFYVRALRDGEVFLRITADGPDAIARFVEPEHVTQPLNFQPLMDHFDFINGDLPSNWDFGVLTYDRDPETPVAYHVVRNGVGTDWDVFSAKEVIHYKRNVDRCVKRGISDFYAVYKILHKSEKLLTNMTEGASIQSAIAYIRQHVAGTTKSGVEAFVAGQAHDTATVHKPGGGTQQIHREKHLPGTILDTPAGMEHLPGPMGSQRAPNFIAVLQAALRAAFARWAMPEFMTGDASNANYSSTMVAEAPFVKGREAEQHILEHRHRRIFWRAIRIAYDAGVFRGLADSFDDIKAQIKIKIDSPRVATRDELALSQQQQIDVLSGTLSRKTAMAERGRNVDDELQNMSDDPALLTTAASSQGSGLLDMLAQGGAAGAVQGVVAESLYGTDPGITESADPFPQFQQPVDSTFAGKKYTVLQPGAELPHAMAVNMMQERGYEIGPLQGSDDLPFFVVKRTGEDERQISPERLAVFLKSEDDRI